MPYLDTIRALAQDAEQLEQVYHAAVRAGELDAFARAIRECHAANPSNLLYAAWFYRLEHGAEQTKSPFIAWRWAVPLALLNGVLYWWLSDWERHMIRFAAPRAASVHGLMPTLAIWAGPIAAACVLAYLALVARRSWRAATLLGGIPAAAAAYVLLTYSLVGTRPFQEQYLTLMALHLPLLAWTSIGAYLTAGRPATASRFAFLVKSLEVFILAGLFLAAGGLFVVITAGLFAALDIALSDEVQRLLLAGGGGLVPVLATAMIYDARMAPEEQSFREGLGKLVPLMLRILLPLTLLVLVIYVIYIPFNWRAPFENRDVLINYNGMLLAVAALLVGVTPVSGVDVAPQQHRWLRRGIVGVAALTLLIGVYALAAILYRTTIDRLTPNRLAFIGWNVINIGLLVLLLALQARARPGQWLQRLHRALGAGTVAYVAWASLVILAVPWLFSVDRETVQSLPPAVQDIVYEYSGPILLKCKDSPHIYLLERGRKRWIDTIETFAAQGYVWRDVHLVACDVLRSIPDGIPIPADAGPPPQP